MNDLERRVTDLLEHDASEAPRVPEPPRRLRRRVRGRQLGTAAIAGVAVFAVVLAGFAGMRAIDRSSPEGTPASDPWAGYSVYDRTATIWNVTISSPSDLYLTRPAVARGDRRSLLQLTTYDPGLNELVCGSSSPGEVPSLPDGEAAMVLTAVFSRRAGVEPAWPVPVDPAMPVTDGPCGPGRYLAFDDPSNTVPYEAWIGTGVGATDDQVHELMRSLETMTFVGDGLPGDPERSAYVIAGGESAAGPWRLEVAPGIGDVSAGDVDLQLVNPTGGSVIEGIAVPDVPIEQAGGDPVFGAVVKEADGVELRLEEGTPPISAQVVPLPPSMPFDYDLFFASNDADVQATAVAIGPDGEPLGGDGEPTSAEIRRVAEGMTEGTAWALDYQEGRQLALVGRFDNALFDRIEPNHMASLSRANPMLIGVHDFGTSAQPHYYLYGVTHHEVDQLSIVIGADQVITLERASERDPSIRIFGANPNVDAGVWWAELPPGPVTATVVAFDAACDLLARGSLALQQEGADTPSAAAAECIEGP
ncbi:MAG: hypothetical protein ACXWH5_07885 [Actinomycetota bacterium]